MKKYLIGLLLILSIIAAGCSQPTVEEATDAFCTNLQAFGDALANLEEISTTSTVGELKDATEAVEDAWNATARSARELNELKLDTIDEAWKNVRRTINQVSADDTLAAAVANVGAGLEEVRAAYEQIGDVACPGVAAPQRTGEPASEPQPVEPVAPADEPAPPGFTGTFSATLMLAGSETEMVLVLNEDSSVFAVMRPVEKPAETVVLGRWQDNGDGTAGVTLDSMLDGGSLAMPETYAFRLEGDQLVAFQFDETVYGADGFSMQRMRDPAVVAETAAVAQQATAGITATASLTAAIPLTTTTPATTTGGAALLSGLFDVPPEQAQPEAVAEPALPASPLGRVWQLQQITQNSGVNYTPDDPGLYTVTFNADETLTVLADCNTGTGTYQASADGDLTIQLSASHAYCSASSLSNQFISYLSVANSHTVQGDQLTIGFSNGAGQMAFTAAQ